MLPKTFQKSQKVAEKSQRFCVIFVTILRHENIIFDKHLSSKKHLKKASLNISKRPLKVAK